MQMKSQTLGFIPSAQNDEKQKMPANNLEQLNQQEGLDTQAQFQDDLQLKQYRSFSLTNKLKQDEAIAKMKLRNIAPISHIKNVDTNAQHALQQMPSNLESADLNAIENPSDSADSSFELASTISQAHLKRLQIMGLSSTWLQIIRGYKLDMVVSPDPGSEPVYPLRSTVVSGISRASGDAVMIKYYDTKMVYDESLPELDRKRAVVSMLRELQILKRLDAIQHAKSTSFVPEIIEILAELSGANQNSNLDEETKEHDLGKKAGKKPDLEGFFIVQEQFDVDLEKLLDPLRSRSNAVSDFGSSMCSQRGPSELNEDLLKLICRRTAQALQFLHSANIVHRNLTPQHILVNESCDVRICGFGQARSLPADCVEKGTGNSRRVREAIRKMQAKQGKDGQVDQLTGLGLRKTIAQNVQLKKGVLAGKQRSLSPHVTDRKYRAPEVMLTQRHYDTAVDVWALGCVMSEAIRGVFLEQNFPCVSSFVADLNRIKLNNLPVFSGDSQFPLSPRVEDSDDEEQHTYESMVMPGIHINDQLATVVGSCKHQLDEATDLSFLPRDIDRKYMRKLQANVQAYQNKFYQSERRQEEKSESKSGDTDSPDQNNQNQLAVVGNLQGVSENLKGLVQNMLEINPYYRLSANEIAAAPALFEIDPSLMIEELEEKEARPEKVKLAIDKDTYHCPASSEFVKDEEGCLAKMEIEDYMRLLMEELGLLEGSDKNQEKH